ncbi:hypothetical protein [Puerhibacterium sp. TATVAM-FAB25]|uniref:hypothetical protein n=1 Tax=Puerhibacterium sp. TATVAM-FAB25 TaxID=3093699 RepID=UPI00397AE21E
MADETESHGRPRQADAALVLGIGGIAASVVPIVGDVVAILLGVTAFVTGCVGLRISERQVRPGIAPALTGTLLGVLAIAVVLFGLIAMTVRPTG